MRPCIQACYNCMYEMGEEEDMTYLGPADRVKARIMEMPEKARHRRLADRIGDDPNAHWIQTARISMSVGGVKAVHSPKVWAWLMLHGKMPRISPISLCGVRWCCNPRHLTDGSNGQ